MPPARGVTEDTITVVYYSAPDNDPVLDFITGPITNDDTQAQVEETVQGFMELFGTYYQTYGRTVDLKIVRASGSPPTRSPPAPTPSGRSRSYKPFAAFGGPALTTAWADEMAAGGVVCICCGSTGCGVPRGAGALPHRHRDGRRPDQPARRRVHLEEAGRKAGRVRRRRRPPTRSAPSATCTSTSSEESERSAADSPDLLSERGVELTERLSYQLDPGRLPSRPPA